jgi:hypothetical protein
MINSSFYKKHTKTIKTKTRKINKNKIKKRKILIIPIKDN